MSTILIFYERMESYEITGQIADRLVQQFGQQIVVMEDIYFPFGASICKFIDKEVGKCDVLLPVIGPTWMEENSGDGKTRTEDWFDNVRIAIESALKQTIPVIPVLVRDAKIPPTEHLPDILQGSFYRHGIEVRSGDEFHRDMDRLIESLKQSMNDRSRDPRSETD